MAGSPDREHVPHYPYRVEGQYDLVHQPISDTLRERVYPVLDTLPQGAVVVDIGCGEGRVGLNAPLPRPYVIHGVDISPSAAARYQRAIDERGLPDRAIAGDITQMKLPIKPHAAVSWRVLHSMPRESQLRVARSVQEALPVNSNFMIAVLSDTDWKRQRLEERGEYRPGQMNDCAGVMDFDTQPDLRGKEWPLYFFSEDALVELAERAGFKVEDLTQFREKTGYKHLEETNPFIDYHFARLRKKVGSVFPVTK